MDESSKQCVQEPGPSNTALPCERHASVGEGVISSESPVLEIGTPRSMSAARKRGYGGD